MRLPWRQLLVLEIGVCFAPVWTDLAMACFLSPIWMALLLLPIAALFGGPDVLNAGPFWADHLPLFLMIGGVLGTISILRMTSAVRSGYLLDEKARKRLVLLSLIGAGTLLIYNVFMGYVDPMVRQDRPVVFFLYVVLPWSATLHLFVLGRRVLLRSNGKRS